MSDPRCAFNWRTTYTPQVDWSDFKKLAIQSKAASDAVQRKAEQGINVGLIKGLSKAAERPLTAYSKAKPKGKI